MLLLEHDSRWPLRVPHSWVLGLSLESGWALGVLGHRGRLSETLGVNLLLREGYMYSLRGILRWKGYALLGSGKILHLVV